MKKPYVITVTTKKGGTGKSTTANNTAKYLSDAKRELISELVEQDHGLRILSVDVDTQGNNTDNLGDYGKSLNVKDLLALDLLIDDDKKNFFSVLDQALTENIPFDVSDVLEDPCCIKDVIVKTEHPNLHLLPATMRLSQTEKNLRDDATCSPINRLAIAFEEIKDDYDVIIIDTAPSDDLIVTNALYVSDLVIIPVKNDRWAVKGMIDTLKNILAIKRKNNLKTLQFKILFTMINRNNNDKGVMEWFKKHIDMFLFDTYIPYQAKPVTEASYTNKQVVETDTSVGNAYKELGKEIIEEIKKQSGRELD